MISPEMLRRFPIFAGLDSAAFKKLAMAGSEVSVGTGDWLFFENAKASDFYVILNGSITVSINIDNEGKRRDEVSTIGEGKVVGWSALVEPYIYTLNAVAETDATLVKLDAAAVRSLMDENPAMGYILMKHLAKAIGERLTDLRIQFVSMVKT